MLEGQTKIIRFDERFPGTGEPTIQLLTPRDLSNVKLAGEAADYVRNVQPVEGKTIVLVLAMSAGEYYGPNRNGDAFAERAIPGAVSESETLPKHYKTFETGAHVYRHHINKDPAKSLGRVLKAFYNWDMHRVELLLELDNELGQDVVAKINAGEYPAVSMGCKIKYDVCSVCGNKAPTRAQYCDHAKYEMNRVYPDGQKSFVWNPAPNLFDISFVIRPADRIGFMMKKVAFADEIESSFELGDKVAEVQEKMSALKKLSDIDKIIRGETVAATPSNRAVQTFNNVALPGLMANTPEFDGEALQALSSVPLPEALSTLASMGITPTAVEITRIMINRAMPGRDVDPHVAANMAGAQGPLLGVMQQHPEILESIQNSGLLNLKPEHVNPQLAQKLGAWLEKRSNFTEYMERRVFQEPHPDIGNWDKVQVQGPKGEAYTTTQGAIDGADDQNVKRQMKILAGAGLLAGVGYKALSAMPSGRVFAPLVGAAGLVGGASMARAAKVPELQAAEGTKRIADKYTGEKWTGVDAPMNAEMRKSGAAEMMSVALPIASSAAVTAMLAQEYNKRREEGMLGAKQDMLNRAVEGAGRVATNHPAPTFLAGLAGIGLGANAAENIGKFLSKAASDSVKLAEVDLDGLTYWLGDRLFGSGA